MELNDNEYSIEVPKQRVSDMLYFIADCAEISVYTLSQYKGAQSRDK